MLSKEDQHRLQASENGGHQAFNALFRQYYAPLCNYAYSLLRDQETAKDAVQQVFTGILAGNLLRSLKQNVKSYLYASVYHRCLRELENRKRRQRHLTRMMHTETAQETPHLGHDDQQLHLRRALSRVIAEMPRQRQQAINLFYFEGHKQVDVARKMGIGLSSVKTHLQLAMATLRNKLHNS